jgi:hypothetical protein
MVRIVKMSTEEFSSLARLNHYFESDLPTRQIPGQFKLPKGKIATRGPTSLFNGEMLLFTYQGKLVRIARVDSGITVHDPPLKGKNREYPQSFIIDVDSIRKPKRKYTLAELDDIIPPMAGEEIGKIAGTQGWNWIPETEEIEDWFELV